MDNFVLAFPPGGWYNGSNMDIERIVKIVKIGNGYGFIIPRSVMRDLNLKRGDHLGLVIADYDTMVAKRLKVVASDTLEVRGDDTLLKINYGK